MLNATTYRTLSATTGLNLGTRTLAAKAGAVNVIVAITLRSALDQSHQRMRFQRFGMRDSCIAPIPGDHDPIPSSPRWSASLVAVPGVEGFAELPPEVRDVVVIDGLVVPVVRPGVPVGKRRDAAKAVQAAAAARPSTRPAARFAAGG